MALFAAMGAGNFRRLGGGFPIGSTGRVPHCRCRRCAHRCGIGSRPSQACDRGAFYSCAPFSHWRRCGNHAVASLAAPTGWGRLVDSRECCRWGPRRRCGPRRALTSPGFDGRNGARRRPSGVAVWFYWGSNRGSPMACPQREGPLCAYMGRAQRLGVGSIGRLEHSGGNFARESDPRYLSLTSDRQAPLRG